MGKGGGHIDESFQVLLGKTSGDRSGAGSSGAQKKKKITRKKKEKVTTAVTVGEEEETPKEDATQESKQWVQRLSPKANLKKKTTTNPANGENEMEASDEDTPTDEATDEDAQTVESSAVPVVSEEGKKTKRFLKKKFGEVGGEEERGHLRRAVPSDVPDRERMKPVSSETEQREEAVETAKDDSLLITAELNEETEKLIAFARQLPFISDTLVEDQTKKDQSGLLCILVGSDGGMSELLKDKEDDSERTETNEEDVSQQGGKRVVVMDEDEENEKELILADDDVVKKPSARRINRGIFTRKRLRIPSNKIVGKYVNALLKSTTHGAWKAMERILRRSELAMICRNVH
ncbi:hypothetical protein Dimus_018280 [Dionaea muscipula]